MPVPDDKTPDQVPIPERFVPARSTLLMDRFMTRFIKVGGVSVITLVLGIAVFILWQILPLFRGAEVEPVSTRELQAADYRALGVDEYAELPFLLDATGRITLIDLVGDRGQFELDPEFEEEAAFTAFSYHPQRQDIVCGTADGLFAIVNIEYESEFVDGARVMNATAEAGAFLEIGAEGAPIRKIGLGDDEDIKVVAVLQEVGGRMKLHAALLEQEAGLFGGGEISVVDEFDLTDRTTGVLVDLLVDSSASSVIARSDAGEVFYFHYDDEEEVFALRQTFRPFDDPGSGKIASMHHLFGDVTLVFTNPEGSNRLFSLYIPPGGDTRLFGLTKQFDNLPGAGSFFARSLRNKAFLIGSGDTVSLRYATTEKVRWEETLSFTPSLGRMNSKYDRIALLDDQNQLRLYSLDDPHPESSFKALFGKLWYEGSSEPAYVWQSTGGSDEFEPKLSMIPLIVGTLKGTFYAMLIAFPIALLAAIYTSQFASPRFRTTIKPTMEIMASLPSVVLGFLAALWLAPLIEDRVPSILLMAVFLPLLSMAVGYGWSALPIHLRAWIRPGTEFIYFIPVLFVGAWICWDAGPALERALFVVQDQAAGGNVADFRLWWPQAASADFQQRNSLVVGFMMGFAVIPIIFTIAEDSLSSVPGALRSASLALGASRWQTAIRVIVPTASAGIFSAVMIGLGRAVGETMIVVMATGNTPIMEWNIFSGMRTLSANIAVELPEAPVHGTLYRTLFLGAMVLFVLTFLVNTVAEILRHRLREKYKTV